MIEIRLSSDSRSLSNRVYFQPFDSIYEEKKNGLKSTIANDEIELIYNNIIPAF